MTHDIATSFRQWLIDQHSPTPPPIDNFKLVILMGLSPVSSAT
ncbi:MAG TPA: hypothetical protein VNY07_00165 [Chthoniobacterales bacterium]|nr:hypothetical protein [Chthoniobacterales bacterium]